jgi:hypothetical protein
MMAGAKLLDFHIYAKYLRPAGLSPESNLTISRFSNIKGGILPIVVWVVNRPLD